MKRDNPIKNQLPYWICIGRIVACFNCDTSPAESKAFAYIKAFCCYSLKAQE